MRSFGVLGLIAAAFGMSFPAMALELQLPLDCKMGEHCFVQQYVDADPSMGYADYTCGRLSYDGHKGTDIRARNLAVLKKGIRVLAASSGTVRAVRDDMPDQFITKDSKDIIKNKECGNGVLITGGEGYEMQYCHLMQKSIQVRPGQKVVPGQVLGMMGYSGMTEFPHLEFLLRWNGQVVDPFVGKIEGYHCGAERQPLWSGQAQAQLEYLPTAVLGDGFSDKVLPAEEVRTGAIVLPTSLPVQSPALLFWVDAYGLLDNDLLTIRLRAPGGAVLAESSEVINGSKALQYKLVGKKLSGPGWNKGTYTGEYIIERKQGAESRKIAVHLLRTLEVQ